MMTKILYCISNLKITAFTGCDLSYMFLTVAVLC